MFFVYMDTISNFGGIQESFKDALVNGTVSSVEEEEKARKKKAFIVDALAAGVTTGVISSAGYGGNLIKTAVVRKLAMGK